MPRPPAFQVPTLLPNNLRTASSRCHTHIRHHATVCAATPPRRKAAVAKDLREALQSCLRARTSRIDLVLPLGAALGTEIRPSDESASTRTRAADRELARVVSGMFERTGLTMRVVFPHRPALRDAQRIWGSTTFEMTTWDAKPHQPSRGKSTPKKSGFASAAAAPASHSPVDVYVLVGGGAAFLARARNLAEQMGEDKLIILVNANSSRDNLPLDLQNFRQHAFESVYHYVPNPHPKWSGGVLFRKFPHDWVLGKITPIGTLQQLIVTPEKPSLDDIAKALGSEGDKPENTILKKISGFMDWSAP